MEADFIDIRTILEHMDSGRTFSLTYVKADRGRGTGGGIVTVDRAYKTGLNVKDGQRLTPSAVRNAAGKNPNHSEHFTRNIVLSKTREVRTIHIDLITRFNGKQVT